MTRSRAKRSIYIEKTSVLRAIKFMLRWVNGDRRNIRGVLLRTWTIHREYLSKRCFSPRRESALPLLTMKRHDDVETRTACIKTLISGAPLNTRETIEETVRQAEGNSRRSASNISAQLVTALPTRESGGKLNQPLEQRNRKQRPYGVAYISL